MIVNVRISIAHGRLKADYAKRALAALLLLGNALRSELAQYPRPPRYPIRWTSPRQRAAYFAKMRAAGESPPYRRSRSKTSERLGKSYTVTPIANSVIVRSRASYSAYVQSAARQQPFHRATGWITDRQAVNTVLRNNALKTQVQRLLLS